MHMAGRLMGQPKLYRAAISGTETALGVLPRFALYNWLNPWGKNRELPHPVKQTFHSWYKQNRLKTKKKGEDA
jgi:L-lactate dehydrogenase complex protein LldF